jgi:hypothetical protein
MSSLTLPKSGGLVNGELLERPMLALPTAGNASSSLLATPTTMDDLPAREGEAYEKARLHGGRTKRAATGNLREQVIHALPTPTARDHKDHQVEAAKHRPDDTDTLNRALAHLLATPRSRLSNNDDVSKDRGKHNLEDQISHLLPTPAVNDMGAGKDPEAWNEWAAKQKAADGRPAPHGKSLEQEALTMLPTPKARDYKDESLPPRITKENWQGGAQLPREIAMLPALTGESTPQQSDDGSLF